MKKKIRHLEIILKLSERCNINCSYCYVFNKGNSAADDSPALLSRSNVEGLVGFLERSHAEYDIEALQIDFHGGEPLMMKKREFEWVCERLSNTSSLGASPNFALQTNGMLVDDEWISLFSRYNVRASVSIDGDRKTNDVFRLDKRGRSTYDATVRGLRALQSAYADGRIQLPPGLLSVITPNADGAATYRHFVDDLNVHQFDFLVPDDTYNDTHLNDIGVGDFMVSALDEWMKDNNTEIYVRLFHTHLSRMMGVAGSGVLGHTPSIDGAYAFTVGSDGLIRVDDTLRSTSDPIFQPVGHVSDLSLSAVLDSPAMREYDVVGRELPTECNGCLWTNVCSGGRLVNRYSKSNRFGNKTVYCNATRRFLSRSAAHLIALGVPEERLEAALES